MARTPLYEAHVAAGGRLVDFAGWDMPIQYSGVIDEYQSVRTRAGLFDVSHMGRLLVVGPGARDFLNRLTTNEVGGLAVGQAQYSMVCNEQGGIKDDIFIYRTSDDAYTVCVNASNRQKILDWFQAHRKASDGCAITDRSGELAQLAVQGPASRALLESTGLRAAETLKLRHCAEETVAGQPCLLARTGYTGELGYELYFPADVARAVWDLLLKQGSALGVKPAGLGARDLLRLEMAYLLYGNDIEEDTSPLEANAGWVVAMDKTDFVGKAALSAQQSHLSRRLIAFELLERGVPRHGFPIRSPQAGEAPIGHVTSGNLSPLLQKGIGLGYVPVGYAAPGTSLIIDIRGKAFPAVVVKPPFYKQKRSS